MEKFAPSMYISRKKGIAPSNDFKCDNINVFIT